MKNILIIIILLTALSCTKEHQISWDDNIHNPLNEEYVEEVAFNLNKSVSEVTQLEFNERYSIK